MEKALAIDKNYPAALNDLAYVEARNRQFDKAFAAMERYIALLPKEPNPQDSYGELLRMAGNFEGSLQHYRAALKIDPDFVTSQLGLGDTYALMGNQEQARVEYDKAIRFAHNEADRLTYGMQKAMTYVRDGNFAEADKEFQEIAARRSRQGAGSAGSAGAAPHGRISGRRQRRAEASEAGRGSRLHTAQPSRIPIATKRSRAFCATASSGPRMPAISRSPTSRCTNSKIWPTAAATA